MQELMQQVISIASVCILILTLLLFIFKGGEKIRGMMPASMFTFAAILFTSGLDSGLLMMPLSYDFGVYDESAKYAFTNPAAAEFGLWGFLVWTFYFLTTYYFIKIEPVIKLFEITWVKVLNNITIIATTAFTAALFYQNLKGTYLSHVSSAGLYAIVFAVIGFSIFSSTKFSFIKIFSVASTVAFLLLAIGLWFNSGIGVSGLATNLGLVLDYFPNIHKFVLPIDPHHEFYIMWWFCWSIMIGQFVARFTSEVSVRTLLISMLVIPSVMLALWFAIIYSYHVDANLKIEGFWNYAMVVVGILFVANSLDSLIRLYTSNLNLGIEKIGGAAYTILNLVLLVGLTMLYQIPDDIFGTVKYVGLVVLFIYVVALVYIGIRFKDIKAANAK